MLRALTMLVAALPIWAIGCGSEPPPDGEPSSRAGDVTIPSAPAPAAREPKAAPKPVAKAKGRCRGGRVAPDWEVRAGARIYLEDGSEAGVLTEPLRVPCSRPVVARGRGCFRGLAVVAHESADALACFDEQNVTVLIGEDGRRAKPEVEVAVGEPEVEGPFPASAIVQLLASERAPIGWCAAKDVRAGVDLDERLVLTFELQPMNAKARKVKLASTKLSDEARACIARRFEHARIPVIETDAVTRIKAAIDIATFVPQAKPELAGQ